jgi:hypothetical protein
VLNGITSLAVAGYLIAVGYQGNARELIALLSEEKEYMRWLAAFLVLYALSHAEATKEYAKPLMGAAFVGLLINASQNQTIWAGVTRLLDLFDPKGVSING